MAFKRQVGTRDAEAYATRNGMAFFEVSPLCDFNIRESFSELSRRALQRNGMERLWRSNKGNFKCYWLCDDKSTSQKHNHFQLLWIVFKQLIFAIAFIMELWCSGFLYEYHYTIRMYKFSNVSIYNEQILICFIVCSWFSISFTSTPEHETVLLKYIIIENVEPS